MADIALCGDVPTLSVIAIVLVVPYFICQKQIKPPYVLTSLTSSTFLLNVYVSHLVNVDSYAVSMYMDWQMTWDSAFRASVAFFL